MQARRTQPLCVYATHTQTTQPNRIQWKRTEINDYRFVDLSVSTRTLEKPHLLSFVRTQVSLYFSFLLELGEIFVLILKYGSHPFGVHCIVVTLFYFLNSSSQHRFRRKKNYIRFYPESVLLYGLTVSLYYIILVTLFSFHFFW